MAKLRNDTSVGGDPIKAHIDGLADDERDYSDQTVQDHVDKIVPTDPNVVENDPGENAHPNRVHWNNNQNRLYFVDKNEQTFRLAMHSDLP